MHEDFAAVMENKNLRSTGAVDSKSSKPDTSVVAIKPQNRNQKKRDGAVFSSGGGATCLAPAPVGIKGQKWFRQKGSDKKQRFKQMGEGGSSGKNDNKIRDNNPDLDADIPEMRKKQNLAHLLNMKFQLAPREAPTVSPYWRATHTADKSRRMYKYNAYTSRAHLSKDHYLQANCQFVVKAEGDYSVYLADPDLMVPWDMVEQIRIWGSEFGSCPICLHTPVAARMTRCGHVYCWPCILHFLALSDKPARPCPICDTPIRNGDLKSVVALEQRQLKIGDTIEMKLMKRHRNSLQPEPVLGSQRPFPNAEHSQSQLMYLSGAGENHVFSKLLLCTPYDVVNSILHWERIELEKQLEAEKDCPESCFIQQALEQLIVRKSVLSGVSGCGDIEQGISGLSVSEEQKEAEIDGASAAFDIPAAEFDDRSECEEPDTFPSNEVATADKFEGMSCFASDSPPPRNDSESSMDVAGNNSQVRIQQQQHQKNVFYFYQSSDGQAIYLHPINVQMLVRSYGSLELSPETICGRIVEIETFSMTEELRNRLRYLAHIPVSKQFQIMEIALNNSVVDSATIEEFRDRVEDRERRRRRKDREERRRDLEIQRAEEAKWGRSKNQPIVHLNSQLHFPGFSPVEPDISPFTSPVLEDQSSSPDYSETSKEQPLGPSFAQMLREGKHQTKNTWPSLSAEANLVEPAVVKPRRPQHSESESDEFTPVPEYRDTFSQALSAAFDQAALLKGSANSEAKGKGERQKKKNKVKQKVLFSTGMNFM